MYLKVESIGREYRSRVKVESKNRESTAKVESRQQKVENNDNQCFICDRSSLQLQATVVTSEVTSPELAVKIPFMC